MDNENILFKKDDFIFKKINDYNYEINFNMTNSNIQINKMIDFGLMKLIYDLNSDIYIYSKIEKKNDNEAVVTLLLKHLFEDLGLPQRYSYIHMTKNVEENRVIFISRSITDEKPIDIPSEAKLLDIEKLICICNIETPHKINFIFHIEFDNEKVLPLFSIQKLIGVFLNKIFKSIKQFIENLQ